MKYSRSQLKEIKRALREHNEKEQENTDKVEQPEEAVTLSEARKIVKSTTTEEETNRAQEAKNAKRRLKRSARKEKSVTFHWHYDVGDAVIIEDSSGESNFGIVLEKRTGTGTSQKEAYYNSGVKVMSSAGQYWVKPSNVLKLDE